MNKEWFSDYKEQISLNNMQEARNVILDNIDKTLIIACAEEIVVREVAYERGRVGRVACPETILGDSCHCHGNYGFRVGRHDC